MFGVRFMAAGRDRVTESSVVSDNTREIAALKAEIAAKDREIRLLTVSYGHTFDELRAAGKAGGGSPYTFDDLLAIGASETSPTVPPCVFVHVPKVGGTTLNHILMKNYRWRVDSYGPDFFPRYYPDEFISLVQPPNDDDTRRPVFFTGHITLDNDVFRHMPVRYAAITMLRDPVQRMISNYRFHSSLTASPHHEAIKNGASILQYLDRFKDEILLQYRMFAPNGGVDEALANLESRISIFGLQDRYDEFLSALSTLLGLPDISHRPLNRTVASAAPVSDDDIQKLRARLSEEIAFYEGAVALYEKRVAALKTHATPAKPHPWRDFYAA
jgi:hypothetical protein